jgi:predicted PurR-regulated permease PerM
MGSDATFAKRLLLTVAVALLLLLAWQLVDVLLLVFASVLASLLFRGLADGIARRTRLPYGVSLVAAVLIVATVLGLGFYLFGAQISTNVRELLDQLPGAWRSVRERVGEAGWLADAVQRAADSVNASSIVSRIGGALGTAVGVLANILLVLFASLYIAAQPGLYRSGLLRLVPPAERERIGRTLGRCGSALQNWLIGQLLAMVLVGTMTGIGLSLLGVPSALALGLFVGLAEFVPIVGPIVGAVPALIIAFSREPTLALWTLGLFAAIQLVEGNVIQPQIQRRMLSLPPAATLFAVLAFGLLFGPMGLLLATPLAVVVFILVEDLYIRDVLKEG